MTRQTTKPLTKLPMTLSARSAVDIVHSIEEGTTTLDAPYQRGDVWTEDQRVALIKSTLQGVPIAAIVINDRMGSHWTGEPIDYANTPVIYAVIDGKQRLTTLRMWLAGELAVPASWFPASVPQSPDRDGNPQPDLQIIEHVEDAADGAYVRYTGLTRIGQRRWDNDAIIPAAEAHLPTVAAEAEVYGLLNSAGTAQSVADLERAATIAAS